MELLTVDVSDPTRISDLIQLADEMMEDPRCDLVIPGVGSASGVVVSVWPPAVAEEVEAGLRAGGWHPRRFRIVD